MKCYVGNQFPAPILSLIYDKKDIPVLAGYDSAKRGTRDACAETITWVGKYGNPCCCILLNEWGGTREAIDALLVHEATHVVETWLNWLNEKEPGEEVRAYMTQSVAQCLFNMFHSKKGKKQRGKYSKK